jgi:predicted Zn-dependent protease
MCVRLQRRSGRFQAAETLLSETIQSCRDFLMVSPADQRTLMRLQECLSLSARSREFNQFIINARDALSRSGRLEADAAFLQSVESRAFLAEFDQLSSWSSRVDRAEVFAEFESVVADADPQMRSNLIELLMRCFQDPTAQDEAAQRLVDLTLAEARIAEDAQGIVDEILSRGSTGGTLQALLGTRCLQRGDCARAEVLLNAARIHSNDQNAIVLNNLAVAMVRVDIRNAGQALIYIDNALTLQPRYPAFEATKGEILIALKRWPEAFELLEHAIAAGFKDPATLEHASIAAAAVGKAEQAELYREEFRLFTAED